MTGHEKNANYKSGRKARSCNSGLIWFNGNYAASLGSILMTFSFSALGSLTFKTPFL